jgi:homoserine dehydrogenase
MLRGQRGAVLPAMPKSIDHGEVAEWLKATVSKTVILSNRDRGFESHPLRQSHFPEENSISKHENPVSLILAGFGHVGKALFTILQEKHEVLKERYGFQIDLKAVLKSNGGFIMAEGDILKYGLGDLSTGQGDTLSLWRTGLSVASALKEIEPGILVESTPSNLQTGEPGLTHIRAALENGWHVATANKGPLVVSFRSLLKLAQKNHRSLKFSGATAAALPTLDIGLFSLAGAEILSIEGILNGTSNFILTRMGEGATYKEALEDAQVKGIAEHNPALDVEGWDTAAKLLLIANSVLELDLTLEDINVQGVTEISPALVEGARKEGKALKLIGKINRTEGRWSTRVSPVAIESGHPLFYVDGTNKGISFHTDTMGSVTVSGGKSDPRGAAAAILKDIIHIFAPLR